MNEDVTTIDNIKSSQINALIEIMTKEKIDEIINRAFLFFRGILFGEVSELMS